MTKPWEEVWEPFEANKGFPAFAAKVGVYEVRVFESLSGEDDDFARAKLAAAAPAMARVLMLIAQDHEGGCTGPVAIDEMTIAAIRLLLTSAGVTS